MRDAPSAPAERPRGPRPESDWPPITCLALKLHVAGSLLAFVDLHIPSWRLKIFGCTFHKTNGKFWVGLPGKPQIDSEGTVLRDERNKFKYTPVVVFDDGVTLYSF